MIRDIHQDLISVLTQYLNLKKSRGGLLRALALCYFDDPNHRRPPGWTLSKSQTEKSASSKTLQKRALLSGLT